MRRIDLIKRLLGLKPSQDSLAARMRTDWDERARQNARHYVATLSSEWSDEEFFKSGQTWIHYHIRPILDLICREQSPLDMRVLESAAAPVE